MHYKNGRPARNGDLVVLIPQGNYQPPSIGVFFDGVAGNDYCNGKFAAVNSPAQVNLQECLHIDDVRALIGDDLSLVPNTDTLEETS